MYSLHTKLMNLYSVKVPMIRAKGLNSLTSAFRNRDGMCSMLVNLSRLNMEKCACLLDRRHLFNWQNYFCRSRPPNPERNISFEWKKHLHRCFHFFLFLAKILLNIILICLKIQIFCVEFQGSTRQTGSTKQG